VLGRKPKVVVVGGGPGGYEAALVAAQLGAQATVVERAGMGGSTVLTDVVPSKTLISTAEVMGIVQDAELLGLRFPGSDGDPATREPVVIDLGRVNERVRKLAEAQSADIARRLDAEGVRVLRGTGRLDGTERVVAELDGGGTEELQADITLVATGSSPRELETARPDGERILTWKHLYHLDRVP